MFLDRIFNGLRRSLNIPLSRHRGAVLQKLSNQFDIAAVGFVKICSKEFSEGMRPNVFIPQIIRNFLQMLLDGPRGDRENDVCLPNAVFATVHEDKLIDGQWNKECPFFLRFLFCDVDSKVGSIFNKIG